jgi:hypothetical protein
MQTRLAWLTFALCILFVPVFPAGATVPRVALLSIALPALMLWEDTPVPRGVVLVTAYVLSTILFTGNIYYALYDGWWFLLLAAAFCIGREITDLRWVFIAAGLALWVNSVVVLGEQFADWRVAQVTVRGGLFINRNNAVEAAAMVTTALVYFRVWWVLPGLVPTLLAGARAPLLALGVVALITLWGKSRVMALLCAAASFALIGSMWWLNAGFSVSSLSDRLWVWYDTVLGWSLFGHGIGMFSYEFPTIQVHTDALAQRFVHPHFELLQIVYEFGIVGVVLVGLPVYRMGRVQPDAAWYALAVFLVEGCFAFPLYMPVTGFLAALCAGHISRPGAALRHELGPIRLGLRTGFGRAPNRTFRPVRAPVSS